MFLIPSLILTAGGPDSDSDSDPNCLPPCADIRLCRFGIDRIVAQRGGAPVVRPVSAAMASWPPLLELFRALTRGLQPLLWTSLGQGTMNQDPVVMKLARQQVEATARHHQLWQHYSRMVEDRGSDHGKIIGLIEDDPRPEDRKMLLEMEGVYDYIAQRNEVARHYGMLLCRAFFKRHMALEHLQPHVALPHIDVMIEEFLNGRSVPCNE